MERGVEKEPRMAWRQLSELVSASPCIQLRHFPIGLPWVSAWLSGLE